jgi:polar amino acid transport system permease protein
VITPRFGLLHFEFLLQGLLWTVGLAAIGLLGGGALGLLVALGRTARAAIPRRLATVFVQVIQGTPLLILMFIAYFGVSIVGVRVPALAAAGFALTIYTGAFLGEVWRGCLQSVPAAQREAGASLGLRPLHVLWLVVLPQALRIAVPPTVGFMVQVIKNTSIASIVGFVELTRAGQVINNSTFQPFLCFVIVGALYFLICYPLSLWSRALELRLGRGMARA